jgi:hypothetical protein
MSEDGAVIGQDADRLVAGPAPSASLLAVLAALAPLDENFPRIEGLPLDPVDL